MIHQYHSYTFSKLSVFCCFAPYLIVGRALLASSVHTEDCPFERDNCLGCSRPSSSLDCIDRTHDLAGPSHHASSPYSASWTNSVLGASSSFGKAAVSRLLRC